MTYEDELLARVAVDREICGGKSYIRGTRIYLAIILDALVEGLSPQEIANHYPCLETDDVRAAVAYAIRLAEANQGVAVVGDRTVKNLWETR